MRGIPIPREPEAAIPRDPYPEPPPLVDEPEVLDPGAGTPELESAWREHTHEQESLRKAVEFDAVEQLDRLRLEALERDALVPPKLGGEQVRRDPREHFWSQSQLGPRS